MSNGGLYGAGRTSGILAWLADLLARLFGERGDRVTGGDETPAAALTPQVLVINFDPVVQSEGGRRMHDVLGWHDPHQLTEGYIDDLADCSGGYVRYEVAAWQDVEAFPLKKDGFRYTSEAYLRNLNRGSGWHEPDAVDYRAIFGDFDIAARVEAGEIDEVWLWGFPYAGFWESTMAGRGAYFCNSEPVPGVPVSRIFMTMGFNYQRGVGEMLESFGHRVESILKRVYGSWETRETHAWNRFTLYDKVAPGRSGCGNVHFAPNSERDYDWGNPRMVWSDCDDWLNYPYMAGERRQVNCEEWGNGDIRAHHTWWLRHLPRAEGRSAGQLNNWWAYAVDFNSFPESR
jgi:hypothetical protein